MPTKLSTLSRLLDVPATDSDDARRRRLLNIFLAFVAVIAPIASLLQVFVGPKPNTIQNIFGADNLLYWYGGLATWILCAVAYGLNRSSRVPDWVAGMCFCWASWCFSLFLIHLWNLSTAVAQYSLLSPFLWQLSCLGLAAA